ncbi:MAG: hypothetical protein GKR97_14495 [Rhizobiaceae bacterium]|nr:hypothetical protein [Rhizobiaceae bacterium]
MFSRSKSITRHRFQMTCGNHNVNDGIRRPLALNIHVYLDDVNQFNGPICFIPGSHLTENRQVASHEMFFDDHTTSYAVWAVDEAVIQAQVKRAQQIDPQQGIVAAMGKRGTALIFFDTTIHCSPANFSPWKRSVFSMILNPVSNAYGNTNRPDYLHHRDLTPVEAGSGDLL